MLISIAASFILLVASLPIETTTAIGPHRSSSRRLDRIDRVDRIDRIDRDRIHMNTNQNDCRTWSSHMLDHRMMSNRTEWFSRGTK